MKKRTISQHFLAAKDRPVNAVALRFKRHRSWLELGWRDYYLRSEAVALALHALDVSAGDRVAVLSNTRWEWAVLDMAILGLGAITVPIYQSSRAEEVEYIIKDASPKVLIVEDAGQLRKCEGLGKKCKSLTHIICIQAPDEMPPNTLNWDDFLKPGFTAQRETTDLFARQIGKQKLDDIATIVYTSGTTGQPKGAILTHEQILSEAEDVAASYPVSPADSTLSFLPYAHVLGRVELWLHTYIGFTLNFAESIDRLRGNLLEVRPTVIIGVPRIFEKIFAGIMAEIRSNPWRSKLFSWLDSDTTGVWQWPRQQILDKMLYAKLREGLGGRLRFTVSGGAPLEPRIAEFFRQAGVLILEGYGLTETTGAVVVNTPSAFQVGTVGRPLGEVQVKLADDGEILLKSKKVMRGYYNEAGAGPFRDGFYCTGDIGEWTNDGYLRITDRKKDLIKTSGGKYVAPQKLEGLLKLNPLISNALIHGDRKKYIVALVTLDDGYLKRVANEKSLVYRDHKGLALSPEVHELVRKAIAQVNSQLASYETIKNFAVLPNDFTIESGELTPSLKVKRKVCDERYADTIAALYQA